MDPNGIRVQNVFLPFQTMNLLKIFHNSVQATSPILFPATLDTSDILKRPQTWPLAFTLPNFMCKVFPTPAPISQISNTYRSLRCQLLHEAFHLILLMQFHSFP